MATSVSVGVQTKVNSELVTKSSHLRDVISIDEVCRFRDLGLGRGVDATNPNMWMNKSPFVVRSICSKISNIIGTEECGIRQYYAEEVSSLTSRQLNIKLSLHEPSSHIKIGIDAENSRCKSSTRKTIGAKVHTRTVSFRTDFNDLPIYSLKDRAGLSAQPEDRSSYEPESFESQLCSWILDRIQAEEKLQISSLTATRVVEDDPKRAKVPNLAELEVGTPVEQMSYYLGTLKQGSPELKSVARYCKDFVKELGITHYVNAIELGALKYQVFTMGEYQNKFGAGATLGVEHLAEATVSGKYQKLRIHKASKLREIGKVTAGKEVKRNSSEEAVIGFHIQPIHKLVQLLYIQVALQNAVKEYVDRKSDKSEGPFLVSCKVDGTLVYWTVNQQHQLVGTPFVQRASPFYVIPTEHNYPCEFFISYYGENKDARKLPVNLHDPMVMFSKQAPLPRYLKSHDNIFGYSDQPLEFTSSAKEEHTRFALFNRIVHPSFMCLSTPVSPSCWIEGEEFFINCNRRSFRIDGYLAMEREVVNKTKATIDTSDIELETLPVRDQSTSIFTSVILPTVPGSDEKNLHVGMLFRLHPAEHRDIIPERQLPRCHGPPFPLLAGPHTNLAGVPERLQGRDERKLTVNRDIDESETEAVTRKSRYEIQNVDTYDSHYERIFGSPS